MFICFGTILALFYFKNEIFKKKCTFLGFNLKIKIILDSLNSGLSLNSSHTKKSKTKFRQGASAMSLCDIFSSPSSVLQSNKTKLNHETSREALNTLILDHELK